MDAAANPSQSQAKYRAVQHHAIHSRKELAAMSLAALGVVYGDIGTSPLYAIKECTTGTHGAFPLHKDHLIMTAEEVGRVSDSVLGVLSMVFWALTLVICIKYLVFVLRADNKGEGG